MKGFCKIKSLFVLKKFIASFSFLFALIGANVACGSLFYQPKLPPEVESLRKF